VGRTLTLLLIFVVTIVAVIVVFAYFSGVLHLMSNSTDSVHSSGVFILSAVGGTTGQLALEVKDTGQSSLVGVDVVCPTSQFSGSTCSAIRFTYQGDALSSANLVPPGQSAGGSGQVASAPGTTFNSGGVYNLTIQATFSDGKTASETCTVAAQ